MQNFKTDVALFISAIAISLGCNNWKTFNNYVEAKELPERSQYINYLENTYIDVTEELVTENIREVAEECKHSVEDLQMLAILTMAEAESEPVEGQRLVISTVLNRVDSEYFPDTISEVILQKNQFSPMWNGRYERCEVRPEIYNLVLSEVEARSNHDTIFFNANHYSSYGTPMYVVGNHYFSSYK